MMVHVQHLHLCSLNVMLWHLHVQHNHSMSVTRFVSMCRFDLQMGDLLILPPWVSLYTVPIPKPIQSSGRASQRGAAHGTAGEQAVLDAPLSPLRRAAQSPGADVTLMHFALPGNSASTAGLYLPMRMPAGSFSAFAGDDQHCMDKQWWAFGNGVAVYDLSQVRTFLFASGV